MCDTRRYGLLDGNALVGRSRYEQNEVAARTRISLAAIKDSFAESKEDRKDLEVFMFTGTEFMFRGNAPNVAEPVPRSTGKGATELGEIVVFIDNRSEAASILEFAGLLAEENGARLISVFIQPAPAVTPPETFARGAGIQDVIKTHESQLESIEGRQRTQFEDIVRRHAIARSEWRSLSHWSTEVAVPAYYADLVVIARPERPNVRPSAPRGIPGVEFRPANHPLSTRRCAISRPSNPRRLERHARGHPGRSGCRAPPCTRRSCRSLDR